MIALKFYNNINRRMKMKNKAIKIQKRVPLMLRIEPNLEKQQPRCTQLIIFKKLQTLQPRMLSNISNVENKSVPKRLKSVKSKSQLKKYKNQPLNTSFTRQQKIGMRYNKENSETPFYNQQTQKEQSQIEFIGGNQAIDNFVNSFFHILQSKTSLFKLEANSIIIERHYFSQVLQYFLSFMSTDNSKVCNKMYHKVGELRFIYQKIKKFCEKNRKTQIKEKITINSTMNVFYDPSSVKKKQMATYLQANKTLQMRIIELIQQRIQLSKQIRQRDITVKAKLNIIEDQSRQINRLKSQIDGITNELHRKQQIVKFHETKVQQIEEYVTKTTQTMKQASEQYKATQSEIQQYAAYLQGQAFASQLNFQTLPFNQYERHLMQQIKDMSKQIDRNKNIEERFGDVKQLMVKSFSFFQSKDNDSIKISNFRGTCIRQFVSKIQKWRVNWQFKQDYLVKLREQFAVDTVKMTCQIQELINTKTCPNCFLNTKKVGNKIKKIYQNIDRNYKTGNYFY